MPVVISKMENPEYSALSDFCRDDLPNKAVFDFEIKLWIRVWSIKPVNQLSNYLGNVKQSVQ